YSIGKASKMTQIAVLRESSGKVDFINTVDWNEEYQMLRVNYPVDVVTETASCEIQFGHVKRPTHHNTSWDKAKFEVCAHKWADMSDNNGGMALLNDCKYGYKVWDGALDLCLLRSQNCPCEHGDMGVHNFTYSIFPHASDVWSGEVIKEGYMLNYPIDQFVVENNKNESVLPTINIISGTAVIETVKKAEDSDDIIVRLYEAAGGNTVSKIVCTGYKVDSICDILEQKDAQDKIKITDDGAEIDFHAFEIHTILLKKNI
ncbi:MAG: glycosyl hydrolase-related protein, partial [Clostridia bacterium]|nr:glycosyl hydrolase-related protein [Clostridia bacterium]